MYELHPSIELRRRFAAKPYQGVHPAEATFLFIGLDANYDADIESQAVFSKILEYHEDGKSFWRRHGVHHPFLLPEYRGGGLKYHRNFARIGFEPAHAGLVSFAEMMHVPTVGRNKLKPEDLDPKHLDNLNDWIVNGEGRFVFVSSGVARLMRSTGQFCWLPSEAGLKSGLSVWTEMPGKTVFLHLHFSNYGKFEARMQEEAAAIKGLLNECV